VGQEDLIRSFTRQKATGPLLLLCFLRTCIRCLQIFRCG